MRNPSLRRARTVRSGIVALACTVGALLTLPAQAAWLVSDTRAQEILRQIQTNTNNTVQRIEDFRDKEQPEGKWNSTGHRGAYKPYNASKREGTDYNYELLGVNMTARSRTEGMEAKCGDGVSSDVPDNQLWQAPPMPSSGLGGLGGSNPQSDQQAICQRLVVSENLRESLLNISCNAAVVFMGFDPPAKGEHVQFFQDFEVLTEGLAEVILVSSAQGVDLEV